MPADRRLSHLTDPDERMQVAKILDMADRSARTKDVCLSGFFSPRILLLAEGVLRGMRDIRWIADGGYPEAERKRLITMPDFASEEPDFEISFLRLEPVSDGTFSHRDVLGAILGLGLVRERIGDIVMEGPGATVVVDQTLSTFLQNELRQAGRIRLSVSPTEAVPEAEGRTEDLTITVSSPRLDALLSRGCALSRAEAEKLIRNDRVQLNWKVERRPDVAVMDGDLVSCRGYGRFRVLEQLGMSKKGKHRIAIRKYL